MNGNQAKERDGEPENKGKTDASKTLKGTLNQHLFCDVTHCWLRLVEISDSVHLCFAILQQMLKNVI